MILSQNIVRSCRVVAAIALIAVIVGCIRGSSEAERLVGKWRYDGHSDTARSNAAWSNGSTSETYKLITPTGWSLTEVNKAGEVTKSSGGTYKLEGDSYTETVEYGAHKGMQIKFNCKLDGEKWYHTGKLPDETTFNKETGKQETFPGFPVDEVWVREK